MSHPSYDGMGRNLRAFYEKPWPRCNCMLCSGKRGTPGLRCALVAEKLSAISRDNELVSPSIREPESVQKAVSFDEDMISASDLSPHEKRVVWNHIKAHRPEIQAFLQDPQVKALQEATGATPVFPADMVMDALGYHPAYSNAA